MNCKTSLNEIKFLVILFFLMCTVLYSQQPISGPQSGTLGPGTYEVVGNITVENGKTLAIEPGTKFEHNGNYAWAISGEVKAVGTLGEEIHFVSKGSSNWGGIQFLEGSSDQSIFDHCIIDKCERPWGKAGGGINVNGASITVQNSTISNCDAMYGGGINATNCSIIVNNCIFKNNIGDKGGCAINLCDCDNATVENCVMYGNSSNTT